MMQAIEIEGAEVILPGGIERVSVRIEGGQITGLDVAREGARVIDATGCLLAPALVDIHGDAFERQLMPRPGVFFPVETALLETDRQLAGNGIATAFHALTLSWEPGLRSVAHGRQITEALAALAPRFAVENRVQLRWETFCFEAIPLIEQMLAGPLTPSVAFNDHTTMGLLSPEVPLQERPFDQVPDYPITDMHSAAFAKKMEKRAARADIPVAEFVALMRDTWAKRDEVPAAIARVAEAARAAGASMLSHDDTQVETRAYYRDLGSRVSEFPMNLRTAEAARAAGDHIIFGAPNVLRGGSHIGSPGAAEMVSAGLCDILASDYYYPAMLAAVARLHAEGRGALQDLWKLVSTNPARASNLPDRGEIAPGQRADLVLLDWPEGAAPQVLMTLSAGRVAHGVGRFGAV
ncbi:alpha-D-ribose 1-methylphosphonate 5-triphosphate diphosphatase [Oceanicola sp. S124]|uniref:alpha-D-ribose 1-methylphosphonate 5-triphosphate diphosphatase n=1 Tax=Oceanicola sp. S124 TaxID=1042378 RepID=UPI0002559043|nr:alpha-D-ribose 1-methylphosphonate 5-triphosphate diphosphatase [Oceanicola sp. S124]